MPVTGMLAFTVTTHEEGHRRPNDREKISPHVNNIFVFFNMAETRNKI